MGRRHRRQGRGGEGWRRWPLQLRQFQLHTVLEAQRAAEGGRLLFGALVGVAIGQQGAEHQSEESHLALMDYCSGLVCKGHKGVAFLVFCLSVLWGDSFSRPQSELFDLINMAAGSPRVGFSVYVRLA